MKLSKFQRCIALALALLLTAALPVTAMADTAELTELVATDITLDETRFEYTGQEIRPNVTVRVDDQLLTLDRDYTLEFKNNVEVGTATVTVTGIPEAGYTGTEEEFSEKLAFGNGVEFKTDDTLTLKDGVLSVNTTNQMERDNTLPITSAGVYATVGNIEALLKTI